MDSRLAKLVGSRPGNFNETTQKEAWDFLMGERSEDMADMSNASCMFDHWSNDYLISIEKYWGKK